jgi:hypothetical protein
MSSLTAVEARLLIGTALEDLVAQTRLRVAAGEDPLDAATAVVLTANPRIVAAAAVVAIGHAAASPPVEEAPESI